MSKLFVLPFMLFLHVFDDFVLQPILLNKLKQKSWWKDMCEKNHIPISACKYDYIPALIAHAFSWAFLVMLPIAIYYKLNPNPVFYLFLALNIAMHALVDHLKANMHKLNLVMDQSIHVLQIVVTYIAMIAAIMPA